MSLSQLPAEVILSLQTVLEAKDELDSQSFSLSYCLNSLFPDEAALSSDLETTQSRLQAHIAALRSEIATLQYEITSSHKEPADENSDLQELVGDLFTQINYLRSGATESEIVVREITRDIKTLDLAKRNIVSSMTGVKRFQMLVNGFDQLTRLAQAKRYRETAQSLLAIKQLQAHFKSYAAIERISTLFKGIHDVQAVLRDQVMADFKAAFASGEPGKLSRNMTLMDACLVVDALGDDARKSVLDWYSNWQMKDYKRIFRPTDEAGHLDNVSRRYAWFRRLLKVHEDDHAAIFPSGWQVGEVLVGVFAIQTRDDLKTVLAKTASHISVALLLDALQATVDFEKEASRKFGLTFEELVKMSPSLIGQPQTIATVFDPYLSIFVDAQDKTIADMLAGYRSAKPLSSVPASSEDDHASQVLPSSTELFYFYRETLEKCAQLSTKSPFLDLCGVFKKWLKVYSEDVLAASLTPIRDTRRTSGDTRLNTKEINVACLVVNTADYCAETAAQLEERLKEKIHTDLKDRVSLESEKEMFLTTIATAITTLLKELELTIEPAFQLMARSPWKDAEYVSSESTYVADLVKAIESVVDLVKARIEQKKYIRSFADHIVGLVAAKYTQTVVKCRPISMIGAEQMLLDLQALKNCLFRVPQMPSAHSGTNVTYTRYVNKTVGRLETVLKGIMTPETPPEAFVQNYLILIPCQSFSDFQKMLDLKGVRRTDQNALLDIFLSQTSSMADLPDKSFLSSIDMDPNASSIQITTPMPTSPTIATSGLFGGFSMLSVGSRDGSALPSRAGTPMLGATGKGVSFADGKATDGQKFDIKRFGSRFFGREGMP